MSMLYRLLAASALGMAVVTGTPGYGQDLTLQLASIEPPATTWGQAAVRFAEAVSERTDGQVEVQTALSGATGSIRETLEALQIGTNDIVMTAISALNAYDELPAIEGFPYLIRDAQHFDAVFNGDVGADLFQEITNRTGFRLIGAGNRGARQVASKREIRSSDDLAGLKIRVPEIEIYRATWEELGASPTPMATGEVYTGLLQGIIDAVENPLEAHLRSRYYEAADYVILTSHIYGAYTLIFDNARFESFPSEVQEILMEEGRRALDWGTEQTLLAEEEHQVELERLGAVIITPDLESFRNEVAGLEDRFPLLKPWVERIQAIE